MKMRVILFIGIIFLAACNVKPPSEPELQEFYNEAISIHNMLVTAQNENRDLTVDEEISFESFDTNYGSDSDFFTKLESGNYHDYKMISLSLSLMEFAQGVTAANYNETAVDDFWNEQEYVKKYFQNIKPAVSLTEPRTIVVSNNSNDNSEQFGSGTDSEIDSDNNFTFSQETIDAIGNLPERLAAAKKDIEERHPDDFSMQEFLYEEALQDYLKLEELYNNLSYDEKNALADSNARLMEDYFNDPAMHLFLFEEELESYKNLKGK